MASVRPTARQLHNHRAEHEGTMNDDLPKPASDAPVTLRRVEHDQDGGRHVVGVYCPRRKQPIAAGECRTCAHCRGLHIDPTERETFLRCAWKADGETDTASVSFDDLPAAQAQSGPTERAVRLSAIMRFPVRCVTPDTEVLALTNLFLEHGISSAPVVDASGSAIGIVSKTDLVHLLVGAQEQPSHTARTPVIQGIDIDVGPAFDTERLSGLTVRDVMTHLAYSLGADASISRAAALMAYEGVHRIIVADAAGKPLGVVSSLDILRWIARRDGYVIPDLTRVQSEHQDPRAR
jgi:CBS domain-containing protein